jgi:hypothetical protein
MTKWGGSAPNWRSAASNFAVFLIFGGPLFLLAVGPSITGPVASPFLVHASGLFAEPVDLIGLAGDLGVVEPLFPFTVAARPFETALGLSLALVILAAFNLALLRHLRRAYASPRRKWREDR